MKMTTVLLQDAQGATTAWEAEEGVTLSRALSGDLETGKSREGL